LHKADIDALQNLRLQAHIDKNSSLFTALRLKALKIYILFGLTFIKISFIVLSAKDLEGESRL
jgi:hypothetical protein